MFAWKRVCQHILAFLQLLRGEGAHSSSRPHFFAYTVFINEPPGHYSDTLQLLIFSTFFSSRPLWATRWQGSGLFWGIAATRLMSSLLENQWGRGGGERRMQIVVQINREEKRGGNRREGKDRWADNKFWRGVVSSPSLFCQPLPPVTYTHCVPVAIEAEALS